MEQISEYWVCQDLANMEGDKPGEMLWDGKVMILW